MGRAGDDLQLGKTFLADKPGGKVAVDLGHLNIHQHQVELRLADPANGFAATAHRFRARQSEVGHQALQDSPVDGIVIDDQHTQMVKIVPGPRQKIGRLLRFVSDADEARPFEGFGKAGTAESPDDSICEDIAVHAV